jgi:steroid 5-alpha reductase family enzyme
MDPVKQSRGIGFFVIGVLYAAGAVLGICVFGLAANMALLVRAFFADAAATLFIWLSGILLQNASVYDPYWSVAPMVFLSLLAYKLHSFGPMVWLILGIVGYWGVRLTANWATTFKNLSVQDWRYTKLRADNPKLWFFINLFGINLVPTIVVYLAMVPAILAVCEPGEINLFTFIGAAVCVCAATVQLIADVQLHSFHRRKENAGKVMQSGLWRCCRHPNYLGEIAMW